MELDDCTTVKDCLIWAEGEWEGFWDFATHQPMSSKDMDRLNKSVKGDKKLLNLINKLKEVAATDKSTEGRRLLSLSATAFKNLQRNINEQKKITRPYKKR